MYARVLSKATREKLIELTSHPDDAIALHAAWELAERAVKSKNDTPPARFLGFVQGRVRLPIPVEWEVQLVGRSMWRSPPELVDKKLLEYLPSCPLLVRDHETVIMRPAVFKRVSFFNAPRESLCKVERDTVLFESNGRTIRLSSALLNRWPESRIRDRRLRASLGSQHSWLACFERYGAGFPIICVETETGRLVWKTDVWAQGADNLGWFTGSWDHDLSIVVKDDKVALFGRGAANCYLEVLEAKTGSVLLRFSTNYWYASR
jgi:hypothetical protein